MSETKISHKCPYCFSWLEDFYAWRDHLKDCPEKKIAEQAEEMLLNDATKMNGRLETIRREWRLVNGAGDFEFDVVAIKLFAPNRLPKRTPIAVMRSAENYPIDDRDGRPTPDEVRSHLDWFARSPSTIEYLLNTIDSLVNFIGRGKDVEITEARTKSVGVEQKEIWYGEEMETSRKTRRGT